MSIDTDQDFVYYNTTIQHNPNYRRDEPSPANTFDTRTDIVLQDPTKYYGSIMRFSIPAINIPISIWPILKFQPDINKSIYSFSMVYGENVVQEYINYFPTNSTATIPQSPVGKNQDNSSGYYFVYDYQHIVDMFNGALTVCLNNLKVLASPDLDNAVVPFFIWNESSSTVSLYCPLSSDPSYDTAQENHISIYFNNALVPLMQGFYYNSLGYVSPSGLDNLLLIRNNNNVNVVEVKNPDGSESEFYINYQMQYSAIDYWNDFQSLLLTTSMRITKEYSIPIGNNDGGNQTAQQNNYSIAMLSDYVVDTVNSAGGQSARFVYNAVTPYRLFEFTSSTPLKNFDLTLFWVDNNNNTYPLMITTGLQCSFKFIFIKKSIYKMGNRY